MRYLIMCRSLTYAQRAARALERSGIGTGVLKAPAGLTGNGCSYCVAVSAAKGQRAVNILRSENLLQGKVFLGSQMFVIDIFAQVRQRCDA